MKNLENRMSFAFIVKPLVSLEKDKYLSTASLAQLKPFIPNIDTEKNIDLLPFYGNCCVANRLNANNDGVDTEGALDIVDSFYAKFIDIEHKRDKGAIGVILSTGFSEFGTDKPLTRDEVKDLNTPFNVCVGGVIWKAINPDLAKFLETTNDPSSPDFLKASISWELAFDSYSIIIMDGDKSNFEDGKLISEADEVKKLSSKLICYGGTGIYDGKKIGRIPSSSVLAVGIALTENPAAEVSGIALELNTNGKVEDSNAHEHKTVKCSCGNIISNCRCSSPDKKTEISTEPCIECQEKNKNIKINVTNAENVCVNQNNNIVNNKISMKITKIEELNDENLKEVKVSELKDMFASSNKEILELEIKKISNDYVAQLQEKENSAKAAKEAADRIEKQLSDSLAKLAELESKCNQLTNASEQKAKLEAFSARMETIESKFDLNDKQKEIVANKIKALDSDDSFNSALEEFNVLFEKNIKAVSSASVVNNNQSVLDAALKNGKPEGTVIPNAAEGTKTLLERSIAAFGVNGWVVVDKRKNRI